jgi:OmpA-OmpF porin, OOP family
MRPHKQLAAMAAAAVIGISGAFTVQAQDSFGGYIGGSVGKTDVDAGDLDSATGIRIYGGYMFTPMYGVEVGYIDAGEFDGKGAFSNTSVEASGAYVSGVAVYPASDRVDVFGKLGFFHYESDAQVGGNTVASDDGTELMFGLGLDYSITPMVKIGAEYNRVADVEDVDVDAFWFNVRYDFQGM